MKSNINIENMEGKMSLRVAYVAVWVITGLIALCSEEGFLPVEYLSHDPNTDYVVGVCRFSRPSAAPISRCVFWRLKPLLGN